jgi:hypothetical protein
MIGGMGVFGHVSVRRAVAAERNPASLAGAQVHPAASDFDALSAFANFRLFYRCNRVEMITASIRHNQQIARERKGENQDRRSRCDAGAKCRAAACAKPVRSAPQISTRQRKLAADAFQPEIAVACQ